MLFVLIGVRSFHVNRCRAARLVIDVGLHEYGWSRQQAIDYLVNTALAHHDIVTEIDCYIAWPEQATAYYLGYKTILNLGSAPLPMLESEVRTFIAERKEMARGQ